MPDTQRGRSPPTFRSLQKYSPGRRCGEYTRRMSDIGKAIKAVFDEINSLGRQGHAALVIAMTARLEHELERCIKKKMRPLSKEMSKRLFEDYGPLNTFASRIDMAFALDITTPEIHAELNKMKGLRNLFAHSPKVLSLDEEPARSLFGSLKRPAAASGNSQQVLFACVLAIDDHLEKFLVSMGEPEDLRILEGTSAQ